jgi:hypothetical protein
MHHVNTPQEKAANWSKRGSRCKEPMRFVNKVLCPRCLFCDFSRHWGEIRTLVKAFRQQRFAEFICLRDGCSHRRFPKFCGSGKHSVKILRNCSITPESLRSTPGFGPLDADQKADVA